MSCMDEVPRKRGDGVPDQGSQDAHTLKTTPETMTGFTQIGGAPVRRKKKKKRTKNPNKNHKQNQNPQNPTLR